VEEGLSRSFTEIGERARTKVLNLFDVDKMVDQTLTAYVSVLKNANRQPKPYQALSLKPA
jgi:hypothetical protein